MAYANFKPLVWSKKIQHDLPKFTVFENDCDYQFSGEAGKGKTVKNSGCSTSDDRGLHRRRHWSAGDDSGCVCTAANRSGEVFQFHGG